MNYTPIQELQYILDCYEKVNNQHDQQDNRIAIALAFTEYFRSNKDVLLYEEKYFIVDAYDLGNDPFKMHRNIPAEEKTNGQIFFENNFINL
jgi:hypothetical protein